MKRSFKERVEALGLVYTKEVVIPIIYNLIILGASVGLYFYLKEIYIPVIGGVLLLILNYVYFSRYSQLERVQAKDREEELISLLSYFEIFLSNGNNVYNSFKMLLPYCSPFMDDAINSLLTQIDNDKTVGPFINFAAKFDNHIIESLLLSIYQMVDNGEKGEQFQEFDVLFSSINKEYKNDLVEKKKASLDSLNAWPLFGAGAITIVLAISTIGIIGDYINVI